LNKHGKKIAVAGAKHTTKDLILGLERHGLQIDCCLTLSPEKAASQDVAGYYDLREFLKEKGIKTIVAHNYNLKSKEDEEALAPLGIDLLLVMGWQRLIPDWFLSKLSIGAFGMHGSSKPLPHGRGRSPMNWSLIQNKNIFYTHLFQYKPGVDDGPVVGVQTFDITPFDDCHTLHFKNTIAMIQLCGAHLPELLEGRCKFEPQPTEGATYYPKRSSEDGLIHFEDAAVDIYNLVRAVTRPFPGAFTFLDNDPQRKLRIWKAIPFDTKLKWPAAQTGEIVEVFYDGSFVVKCGQGTLLALEYEGAELTEKDDGRICGPAGMPRKIWENLPD
jgi:methionyl-tRNA formyltransferase